LKFVLNCNININDMKNIKNVITFNLLADIKNHNSRKLRDKFTLRKKSRSPSTLNHLVKKQACFRPIWTSSYSQTYSYLLISGKQDNFTGILWLNTWAVGAKPTSAQFHCSIPLHHIASCERFAQWYINIADLNVGLSGRTITTLAYMQHRQSI
jgi:hypothetical protein